ncbi:low-density lipoprotein receptor-related protein [Elysia marginata]|uniref:Low-density lipoprotein receptor-related protein n=1 Tax=Elysia marginata TaxID=1093978 RepID=A0AAV4HR17_9GAST|nr:low-density lipoprotein receptor-related protein [Elysia marginata]
MGPSPRIVSGRADGMSFGHTNWPGFSRQEPATLVFESLRRPSSLSLDLPTSTLFWVDSQRDMIGSVSLDGRYTSIIHRHDIPEPSALVVFENRIMWANTATQAIMQTEIGFKGQTQVVRDLDGDDDVIAMAVSHATIERHNDIGSCMFKTCNGVCLIGPQRSAVCACSLGAKPNDRNGDCTDTTGPPMLFGAYKQEIIAINLEEFSPLSPYALRTNDMADVYALAYLPNAGDFLFVSFQAKEGDVGKSTIYRLSLSSSNNGTASSSVVIEDAGTVDSLAVDELSRLIYWVDRQKETVEIASLDGRLRSRLPSDEIAKPYAITLNETQRSLYISDLNEEPSIKRCHQDGRNCVTMLSSHLIRPNALAIKGNNLYWTDSGSGDVSSMDVISQRITYLAIGRHLPHSLAVSHTAIFWTEQHQDGVYYVSMPVKSSISEQPTEISTGRSGVASILVAMSNDDAASNSNSVFNNCAVHNGGCEHLCIPGLDTVTCLCSHGFRLQPDQASCQEEANTCRSTEVTCTDGSRCIYHHAVCDFFMDCDDGSDEVDCSEMSCSDGEFRCTSGHCMPAYYFCDNEEDCFDKSDVKEENCKRARESVACGEGEWTCASRLDCIDHSFVCDGDKDCYDYSDEEHCHG